MTHFWPLIFLWARSTSGIFSHFLSDNNGENWTSRIRIWPWSFVLHATSGISSGIASNGNTSNTIKRRGPLSSHRASFRDYTIRQYENRLRLFSHPTKIFRYFATIKMKNKSGKWELYMTARDFLRSIQPGEIQPQHLGLDKFHVLDEKAAQKWQPDVSDDSIFLKIEKRGLLTYSDYVLLSILLSIPERNVRIGFKLFDANGDGDVTIEDMEQVLVAITQGEASVMNSHLRKYLFDSRFSRTMGINDFLEFLQELHTEIHTLQFENLLKGSRSVISELDFAKLVLGLRNSHSERLETLQRVKKKFGNMDRGISLEEFLAFFRFVQDVSVMDNALAFYYFTGADISPKTLRHISHVVTGVELSEHLTDVIFSIFDHDRDNIIQRNEFTKMRRQWMHPVPLRKNLRLSSTICIVCKCIWKILPTWKSPL
ncbi:calcium uptake protein 1 homolog, mitochondrial isoform X2 [Drosophila takahashii]|uniref:calcium uptake protein 1 homolog, mitochondrial isoform X2 n=1 Tax=Drosophila takahashii TaxID=29030 RepID=UPI001CF81644|nr:calcium uptake protein 1 homolog, mitochondrial [Drosophila takahashii]